MNERIGTQLEAATGGASARVLAVSVGVSAPLDIGAASPGLVVESGIRKRPVSTIDDPSDVEVKRLGLTGDEQADLSVHGGLDKAVYLYPVEHYEWWRRRRLEAGVLDAETPLMFGALGENLTTTGLLENTLWIGDRIEIGEVVLRVEAPRSPCFKLNAVMGYKRAVRHMLLSGRAGIYLSVVTTGFISGGAPLRVIPGRREESIVEMLDWRRSRARREA
ncbi:MOSC family protein [Caballeronia choica]|uniref:MOSC family protein n=1 Tax=Caballeronia choica TaxID=326476 RepID=A0A158GVD9_9BURK|nr:MOSC domain-containing protein [Caballeronia choica]SAL36048.1 MOSC family protein [Caballeronia choica]